MRLLALVFPFFTTVVAAPGWRLIARSRCSSTTTALSASQ